jgi:hypothetical protein
MKHQCGYENQVHPIHLKPSLKDRFKMIRLGLHRPRYDVHIRLRDALHHPVHRAESAARRKALIFWQFELKRGSLAPPYAGQNANERASAKIQEYFDQRVAPIVDKWNRAATQPEAGRVLVIEPRIEHIKFIGGGARFWVGPLAGSSAVIIKVEYFDKAPAS